MEGDSCAFTRMEDIWQLQNLKMVTKILRHYDLEERQTDGSRHWDTIRPILVRAFAQEGARDFVEKCWIMLIHEGSNKKRMEHREDNNGSLCYLRAIQDTLVVFQQCQN